MDVQKALYHKIVSCLKGKKITITEIAAKTNTTKQVVSHRILNIKRRGIVDLTFLKQIEDITGEKFLEV